MIDPLTLIGHGGPARKRKDATQDAIALELREVGILWFDVHNVSNYVDGLAMGYDRDYSMTRLVMVEIKTPGEKLRPNQAELKDYIFDLFPDAPYLVATNSDQIIEWFGAKHG